MKVLILDINGTVNCPKDMSDRPINKWDDQIIMPEAVKPLQNWTRAGWLIVGATNQGGVPRYKSLDECIKEQHLTIDLCASIGVKIETIFAATLEFGSECLQVGGGKKPVVHDVSALDGIHGDMIDASCVAPVPGTIYRKPDVGMFYLIDSIYNADEYVMVGDRQSDRQFVENLLRQGIDIKFIWASEWHTKQRPGIHYGIPLWWESALFMMVLRIAAEKGYLIGAVPAGTIVTEKFWDRDYVVSNLGLQFWDCWLPAVELFEAAHALREGSVYYHAVKFSAPK